jgi:hypothetical protein
VQESPRNFEFAAEGNHRKDRGLEEFEGNMRVKVTSKNLSS